MSDEHGHGPSNDKPMLAGLAVVAALGIALGVGRVDPYGPTQVDDEGAHQELRVGDVTVQGEVHGHGEVLQVHTPKGVVFVPRKRAVVTPGKAKAAEAPADHHHHHEGESVSGEPIKSPLDQLALLAFSRRNSRLYGEALPLYAELVTLGQKAGDPRTEGWAQTLGKTVEEYAKSRDNTLARANRIREILETIPGHRSRVWLTDAYATLLRWELTYEHPKHHEALGELLKGMGPQLTTPHAGILRQLDARLNPPHEGGGILVPQPPR